MPRPIRSLTRWRDVQVVLLRYGFETLIDREEIQDVRKILRERFKLPVGQFSGRSLPERVRLMLGDLGPTYVKLGQILSSRSDLLPPDWVTELSRLQDEVPPFPFEKVRQTIEEDFGRPLEEIYLDFDPKPVAAASLGQVHRATLLSLEPVVVKVLRPGIHDKIQTDMEMMREIARLIEDRTAWGKNYSLVGITEEFNRTIHMEMDYHNEAANITRLRRNMTNFPSVYVPRVYWELVSQRVLTMEAVTGVKVNDVAAMDAAGLDRPLLARVFINSIFKQLLLDGFFHADPHPGNLMVDLDLQRLNYLDMGMMGTMLPERRRQLGSLVGCILKRDSHAVLRLVLEIGDPYREVNERLLEREIDRIINRYLEETLERISVAALMRDIVSVIFEHGIRLPSELTLALKAFFQGEAVARTLDPGIVILDVTRSVASQVIKDRLQPQALFEQASGVLNETLRLATELPHSAERILTRLEAGKVSVGVDVPDIRREMHHVTTIINRMTVGLIMAGMIIGSAIAMGVSPEHSWIFIPILGIAGFLVSMLIGSLLVWMVFWDMWTSRRRKDD